MIAFAWYESGIFADNFALQRRVKELEKEIERYKNDTELLIDNHNIELNYYKER